MFVRLINLIYGGPIQCYSNWIEILVHTSSYFIGNCLNGRFRFTIGGHHLKIELVKGSYMIIFLAG